MKQLYATTFNEVDMTAILRSERSTKNNSKRNIVGLGFMSFFTKSVTTVFTRI